MAKIRNLGPQSSYALSELGIDNVAQLKKLGWKKVMVLLSEYNTKFANVNMAYALLGALQNKHWLHIDELQKNEARQFVEELKNNC